MKFILPPPPQEGYDYTPPPPRGPELSSLQHQTETEERTLFTRRTTVHGDFPSKIWYNTSSS